MGAKDVHSNLHDGERLLCAMRPTAALLVGRLLIAFFGSLFVALTLALVTAVLVASARREVPGVGSASLILASWFTVIMAVSVLRQLFLWRNAQLRVTTERMLLQYPTSLFSEFQKTIKWNQYQESYVGGAGALSLLFRSRPVCIRYGNADGELIMCFPALRHAKDLKHYLDKADAFVRRGEAEQLPAFIEKPRGERD
jgi:hypothetical protein